MGAPLCFRSTSDRPNHANDSPSRPWPRSPLRARLPCATCTAQPFSRGQSLAPVAAPPGVTAGRLLLVVVEHHREDLVGHVLGLEHGAGHPEVFRRLIEAI